MEHVPEHIAVIMDGNGRWAKKRFLSRNFGHEAGAKTLKKIGNECEKLGVKYLTAYAFSTENWSRSEGEVKGLMNLLRKYIDDYIKDSSDNEMRFKIIGRRELFDIDIVERINKLEELTKDKKGLTMIIALDYGARDEIKRAFIKMSNDLALNKIDVNSIDENLISSYLDTNFVKDPDLLIRTSGEMRTSNFLLWQTAYTEFYFSDVYWPDFNEKHLHEAINSYNKRSRRFGG